MATVDRKEDLEKRLAQLHTERDEAEKMLRSKLSSDDRQRYLAEMERLEKEISQNEMELRQIRGTPSNGAAGIPIIGGMQLSKPLSPSSHQAFEVALAIGQQVGQSLLVSETLLIGLNYKADGPTRAVLTAFGWPPDKFFQWLHHRQGWSLSVESLERASTSTTSLDLSQQSISTNIERILDRATQIAEERGANWIRTRYLLTALLDVGLSEENERQQPVAYQWLQEMGIPMGQVRTVLAQVPEKAKVVSSMFAYSASSAFADTAAQQDTLGFEQYAQALAEIIVKPETIPPVVIGIYGPWGSGKSTFLELVKRHLVEWDEKQHPDQTGNLLRRALSALLGGRDFERGQRQAGEAPPRVVCVQFNAWAYTDAEKLWAGLVRKITPTLDGQIPWWRKPFFWAKRSGWRFIGAVVVGLLPVLAGAAVLFWGWIVKEGGASPIWGTMLQQINEWEWLVKVGTALVSILGSITVFVKQRPLTQVITGLVTRFDPSEMQGVMSRVQTEFNQTVKDYFLLTGEQETAPQNAQANSPEQGIKKLRQKKLKVVVMIDELDRCPLEKIVDILEAIKIFLAEEIFIVLMAVDTRVVAEAVRLHYKEVDNPNLAREYLEKIIQIPIPVPEANKDHLAKFVTSLMTLPEETTTTETETEPESDHSPASSEPAALPRERGRLAVSEDLFNPLQLSDTIDERKAITHFALTHLDSNPRRVKRLLNTYRYVKILATRQGERTDRPEWQKKMINWLGFTMCWPVFMQKVVNKNELSTDETISKLLAEFIKELPATQQPPSHALKLSLPTGPEITRFGTLADNFIAEYPHEILTAILEEDQKEQEREENEQQESNTPALAGANPDSRNDDFN